MFLRPWSSDVVFLTYSSPAGFGLSWFEKVFLFFFFFLGGGGRVH